MTIWPGPTGRNLRDYGVFAATERLLMEAVKAGGDRQQLHELIREQSLLAWQALQKGQPNPLVDNLLADPRISALVPPELANSLLDASAYVGDAPQRARNIAAAIRAAIA